MLRPHRLVAILVLVALAPLATGAPDPDAAAFRGQAKAAAAQVRSQVAGVVKDARTALKAELVALGLAESSLDEAHAAAVQAILSAQVDMVGAAVALAEELAAAGRDRLDAGAAPGPDFADGHGGAWDDFRARVEGELDKADLRLAAEFARFVKGFTKLADTDVDVRWRVHAHDRRVDEVLGPVLLAAQPVVVLAALGPPVRQVLMDSRFVLVDQDPVFALGGVVFDAAECELQLRDTSGAMLTSDPIAVGGDGVFSSDLGAAMSLLPTDLEVVLRVSGQPRDRVLLSLPRLVPDDSALKPALKEFRVDLRVELGFGGQLVRAGLKHYKQETGTALKQVKQGELGVQAAAQSAVEQMLDTIGEQNFWLPLIQGNPVNQLASTLAEDKLGAEVVTGDMVPDGDGLYADFLARLSRLVASSDRALGKALQSSLGKLAKEASKQGGSLDVAQVLNGRDPVEGFLIDVGGSAIDGFPSRGPQLLLGVASSSDAGLSVDFHLGGIGDLAGGDVDVEVTQIPGGTSLIPDQGINAFNGLWETGPLPISGLPVVGHLFRATGQDLARPHLLMLVTPGIVELSEE